MEWPGEEKAWDALEHSDPDNITSRSGSTYSQDLKTYTLPCLGHEIIISVNDRSFSASSELGTFFLTEFGRFSRLSILNYLTNAKDVPLSGSYIRPSDISGGDIFIKGTHTLPLERISEAFGNNSNAFMKNGDILGAQKATYGDMSLILSPFPRIPLLLIVWTGDDEFPSKSSLLFDSTCTFHLATDILWSTAMMTIGMMLQMPSAPG